MQCANYNRHGQCQETAAGKFPCCSARCGYEFKRQMVQISNYKAGLLKKEELVDIGDIRNYPWSEEEFLYYLSRV